MASEKTTISRGVKLLAEQGWVVVEPGEDQRRRVVSVTAAGKNKIREARPHWERAQERMRAALTGEGFERLKTVLPDAALAAMSA